MISAETSVLICGGDINMHLHPSLDSTIRAKTTKPEALDVYYGCVEEIAPDL